MYHTMMAYWHSTPSIDVIASLRALRTMAEGGSATASVTRGALTQSPTALAARLR